MAETKTTRKRKPKAETPVEAKVEEVEIKTEALPEERLFMSRRALRREKLREMFGITK